MRRLAITAVVIVVAGCGDSEESSIPVAGLAELTGPYQTEPYRAFDRAIIDRFDARCRVAREGIVPPALEPVLADIRGKGRVTLLYAGANGGTGECSGTIDATGQLFVDSGGSSTGGAAPELGPLELGSQSGSTAQSGSESWSTVSGSMGSEVGAVVFEMGDGTRIVASVGPGIYAAWWPGSSSPQRTIVYDKAGNVVSQAP